MQTQPSRYYRRLINIATLHFKANILYLLLGDLTQLTHLSIEIHGACSINCQYHYCARADFGDGVKSAWYEISFPPHDGKMFTELAVFPRLLSFPDAIATVDLWPCAVSSLVR